MLGKAAVQLLGPAGRTLTSRPGSVGSPTSATPSKREGVGMALGTACISSVMAFLGQGTVELKQSQYSSSGRRTPAWCCCSMLPPRVPGLVWTGRKRGRCKLYRYDPTDPVSASQGCGQCDDTHLHMHCCRGRRYYAGKPPPTGSAQLRGHMGLSVTTR